MRLTNRVGVAASLAALVGLAVLAADPKAGNSPHADALGLVLSTQADEIRKVEGPERIEGTGEERWWHDTKERTWVVQRPFSPGLLDSTHLFDVTYRIEGKDAAAWLVDTRKKSVSRREAKDPAAKTEPAWGKPLKGLRLGLLQIDSKGDGKTRLSIVLDNAGKEDFFLLLGDSFALGKKHDFDSVRLRVTDGDGRKRVLLPKPHHRDDEADGALVTHFALQLVADGQYAIARDLTDFYDPDDVDAVLPAGRYRVTAEFAGRAPTKDVAGTSQALADLARMHFWTGSIQSEEIQVTVPAQTAR